MKKLFTSVLSLDFIRKLLTICVIILMASCLGYIVETIFVMIRHQYIDNRGMYLPFLLGYGLAIMVIYHFLGTPDAPRFNLLSHFFDNSLSNHAIYAIEVFLFITISESLFGNLIYHICHIEWWNYNSIPLHIGQYTSVPTSLGFTSGILFFMQNIFEPLYQKLTATAIEQYALPILILSIAVSADCIYALFYMYKNKNINLRYRKHIAHSDHYLLNNAN